MLETLSPIEYFIIYVNAITNASKYDKVPFDPTIINFIIKFYNNPVILKYIPSLDFRNILYLLMEEQQKKGFIITPILRMMINEYRKILPKDRKIKKIENQLIKNAKIMLLSK